MEEEADGENRINFSQTTKKMWNDNSMTILFWEKKKMEI